MDNLTTAYRKPSGGSALWVFQNPANTLLITAFFGLAVNASGTSAGSSSASAAVYGRAEIAGTSAGSSSAVAIISGRIEVSGASVGSSSASVVVYGYGEVAGSAAGSSVVSANVKGFAITGGSSAGIAAASATLIGASDGPQDAAESVYLISRVRTGYTGISKVRMAVSALLPSTVFTEKQIVSAVENSVTITGPVRISFTAKSVIK